MHPSQFECFCLRILLHNVRGPKSFEDIRTVDGVTHDTFRETCLSLGLLDDDRHWDQTLEEAEACQLPKQMRSLFAIMLISCEISDQLGLWEKYKEAMSQDVLYAAQQLHLEAISNEHIINKTLILLQDHTLQIGGKSLDNHGLPIPNREVEVGLEREVERELSYDTIE